MWMMKSKAWLNNLEGGAVLINGFDTTLCATEVTIRDIIKPAENTKSEAKQNIIW